MLMSSDNPTFHQDLVKRAGATLKIMHRWGYAPQIEALSEQLLGGPATAESLHRELEACSDLILRDGFVSLRGYSDLIQTSRNRVNTHKDLRTEAVAIAGAFAKYLARSCPAVDCIALSGSLASGGYGPQDDIDFDLIVRPGTKYTCYLVALMVGLRFSWRYRRRRLEDIHRTPLFPKITCINVVWTEDQTRPFARQDENMAFELMRAHPLFGAQTFDATLESNHWVEAYFPQMCNRVWPTEPREEPNALGRIVGAAIQRPKLLRWIEVACRRISWILYRYVQRSRRSNPRAVARMEFLRKAKFPYEVFQD